VWHGRTSNTKQCNEVSFIDHGRISTANKKDTHDGHAYETACDGAHLELLDGRHLLCAVDERRWGWHGGIAGRPIEVLGISPDEWCASILGGRADGCWF
jgi:hypothetical protein